jgi:hypothetical protein
MRLICKFLLSLCLLTLSSFAQQPTGPERSLKDLSELVVGVNIAPTPNGGAVDAEAVRAQMEAQLTAAGFKIVPKLTPKSALLGLTVYPWALNSEATSFAIQMKLVLMQMVNLERDPALRLSATTWTHDSVGPFHGNIQGQALSYAKVTVDALILDKSIAR